MLKKNIRERREEWDVLFLFSIIHVFAKGCPFYSYSIVTPSGSARVVAYRLTKDLFKAKKRKCLSEMGLDVRNLG